MKARIVTACLCPETLGGPRKGGRSMSGSRAPEKPGTLLGLLAVSNSSKYLCPGLLGGWLGGRSTSNGSKPC